MKIVLQRVKSASVSVCDKICGQIDNGYLVLVGFGADDTESDCERLAEKIINLRVFSDENGKINLNRLCEKISVKSSTAIKNDTN